MYCIYLCIGIGQAHTGQRSMNLQTHYKETAIWSNVTGTAVHSHLTPVWSDRDSWWGDDSSVLVQWTSISWQPTCWQPCISSYDAIATINLFSSAKIQAIYDSYIVNLWLLWKIFLRKERIVASTKMSISRFIEFVNGIRYLTNVIFLGYLTTWTIQNVCWCWNRWARWHRVNLISWNMQ